MTSVICIALRLHPLDESQSFPPKQILLREKQRVQLRRQTGPDTLPTAENGFFDSCVLSRLHAEVWAEEGGKVCSNRQNSASLLNIPLDFRQGHRQRERHVGE
jgi:hypothetical protein